MKKRFFRDAIEETLSFLRFPFLTPRQPVGGAASGTFQAIIRDSDREVMLARNQIAHAIIVDVASDALSSFSCVSPVSGEKLPDFDPLVQKLFLEKVRVPLFRALVFLRLHGYCGLLVGFRDHEDFALPAPLSAKIDYLQPIPKSMVNKLVLARDPRTDQVLLPPELLSYELKDGSFIHSSRLIHLYNFSLDVSSLEGISVLDPIFDVLTVLKSLDWSFGQIAWRQGAGLTVFTAPEGASQTYIDAIDSVVADINAKSVFTLPYGVSVQTFSPTFINPAQFYPVFLNQVAAGSRVPVSILIGSQAGTLTASEKDRSDYFELLRSIQRLFIEPALYRIVHLLQASGQLPKVDFELKFERPSFVFLEEAQADYQRALAEHRRALASMYERRSPEVTSAPVPEGGSPSPPSQSESVAFSPPAPPSFKLGEEKK